MYAVLGSPLFLEGFPLPDGRTAPDLFGHTSGSLCHHR